MRKLKKPLLILLCTIILIIVLVIAFISPITKYAIEKYDEKYTGRQITMDWAYVNPFTGYVHFSDLKTFELKSDRVFFSTDGFSLNLAMLKLFSKTYEISAFSLNNPRATIIQNKKDFNYNDLIEKFTSKEPVDTTKAPLHLNILDIKLTDGIIYYREEVTPINYFIKNVNIHSTGTRWDADTVATKFSFASGSGSGDVKGDVTVNLKNKDYRMAVVITKFDLNIIEQYLKDLTNYGSFSANLDADIKSTGTLDTVKNVTTSGMIAINDFHFGKNPKEDYASFEKLVVAINVISPKQKKFYYDSLSLVRPFFKYEKYDYLDNMQTMFGQNGAKIADAKADSAKFNLVIEIANYIKELSKNFFKSHYKMNRLAIYDGDIKFNDFSTAEKFSAALNPLTIIADSIDKNRSRVTVDLNSSIEPYGKVSVAISINPSDSSYFDLNYHVQKVPASMFNPYVISQTEFPFDRGTIELEGEWNVRNANIKSDNHLIVIDPRITKRVKNTDTQWLPMRLIMAFVREKGNVIDYEVPITGNLNDPKFHLKDIIADALKNIFIKPASTSYRMQVKKVETEIEKSLAFKWEMRNSDLNKKGEKFIETMADFLKENPEATITITPQNFTIKEKEYILFFEAKKKYYLITNNTQAKSLNEFDLEAIGKMSVKDSMFVYFLNKQAKDSMLFTIQDKCRSFIVDAVIDSEFDKLNAEREKTFISYFKKKEVDKRIKFSEGDNIIPYNGFSFYKINYKGVFPESLLKAYHEMLQMDEEKPRKKFKLKRKQNPSSLTGI